MEEIHIAVYFSSSILKRLWNFEGIYHTIHGNGWYIACFVKYSKKTLSAHNCESKLRLHHFWDGQGFKALWQQKFSFQKLLECKPSLNSKFWIPNFRRLRKKCTLKTWSCLEFWTSFLLKRRKEIKSVALFQVWWHIDSHPVPFFPYIRFSISNIRLCTLSYIPCYMFILCIFVTD